MHRPIDYASPQPKQTGLPQTSALAVLSMLISILACPCLSGWFFMKLNDRYRFDGVSPAHAVLILLGVALITGVVALIRIKSSDGQLLGADFCYFSFTFCAVWLVVLAGISLFLRQNIGLGPGD